MPPNPHPLSHPVPLPPHSHVPHPPGYHQFHYQLNHLPPPVYPPAPAPFDVDHLAHRITRCLDDTLHTHRAHIDARFKAFEARQAKDMVELRKDLVVLREEHQAHVGELAKALQQSHVNQLGRMKRLEHVLGMGAEITHEKTLLERFDLLSFALEEMLEKMKDPEANLPSPPIYHDIATSPVRTAILDNDRASRSQGPRDSPIGSTSFNLDHSGSTSTLVASSFGEMLHDYSLKNVGQDQSIDPDSVSLSRADPVVPVHGPVHWQQEERTIGPIHRQQHISAISGPPAFRQLQPLDTSHESVRDRETLNEEMSVARMTQVDAASSESPPHHSLFIPSSVTSSTMQERKLSSVRTPPRLALPDHRKIEVSFDSPLSSISSFASPPAMNFEGKEMELTEPESSGTRRSVHRQARKRKATGHPEDAEVSKKRGRAIPRKTAEKDVIWPSITPANKVLNEVHSMSGSSLDVTSEIPSVTGQLTVCLIFIESAMRKMVSLFVGVAPMLGVDVSMEDKCARPDCPNDEAFFEPEGIYGRWTKLDTVNGRVHYYLVRWKKYPWAAASWEPQPLEEQRLAFENRARRMGIDLDDNTTIRFPEAIAAGISDRNL
ncbi:unnamed protein product [Mycena citricolor]|uniref:Chromo domain-containing protein n=1 Tax=Mycena citricolor TaxID=2018698 RepID=A0AAD2GTJ9_9AGAR|nr:unnamed protein product [Mycena citricolor]